VSCLNVLYVSAAVNVGGLSQSISSLQLLAAVNVGGLSPLISSLQSLAAVNVGGLSQSISSLQLLAAVNVGGLSPSISSLFTVSRRSSTHLVLGGYCVVSGWAPASQLLLGATVQNFWMGPCQPVIPCTEFLG